MVETTYCTVLGSQQSVMGCFARGVLWWAQVVVKTITGIAVANNLAAICA